MAWDQKVGIYFWEESQEDERDEHCKADEWSGRWWVEQSMKMKMRMRVALMRRMFGGGVLEEARELLRSVDQQGGSSSAEGNSMRGGGTVFLLKR